MSEKSILKMPRVGALELLGYVPPELHTNKSGWYIDYYVKHPLSGDVIRKKVKLNKARNGVRRDTYARTILNSLTNKLAKGWNPFHEQSVMKPNDTFRDALGVWTRVKPRQLRHSSPVSYASFTNVLKEWCEKNQIMDIPAHGFNRTHASNFLAYVSDVRMVGNTTYNNYLVFFSMLMKWMIERGYRTDNPFLGFARRREVQKTRTYLTNEERLEMAKWIATNDPTFWLPCLFVYGTLIRPAELKRLRVEHVDLERQVVFLPAEETKHGYDRTPAIPKWMVDELRAMDFDKQPRKAWLIGKRVVPGDSPIARNRLGKQWVKMRTALQWPDSKQFYSLRDTGIIQLIRDGVDLLHVMQQAGHKDIATTNSYLRHAFPNGPAEVRDKSTSLQASSPIIIGAPMFSGLVAHHNPTPRFEDMERHGAE